MQEGRTGDNAVRKKSKKRQNKYLSNTGTKYSKQNMKGEHFLNNKLKREDEENFLEEVCIKSHEESPNCSYQKYSSQVS